MKDNSDLRKNKRLKPQGLTIDFDNGVYTVDGSIEDISYKGLKVTHLPNQFYIQKNRFISISTKKQKTFQFEITPCWINRTFPGNHQEVGFKIIDPPESWTQFIQKITSETEPVKTNQNPPDTQEESFTFVSLTHRSLTPDKHQEPAFIDF